MGFLSGKTVLVLGGSSGFGHEVARMAGDAGAGLILVGRDAAKAGAVAAAFRDRGVSALGHGLDATDTEALTHILKDNGRVDHVVSMIGGAMGGGFLSADAATIRRAVEEKFFANLTIARAVAPYIAAGGSLTMTAGAGGRADTASGAIIGNQAISTLVRGLAVEMAPRVRANAVAPTWTPTPLWRALPAADVAATQAHFSKTIPLGRTAEVAEVAEAYLFLMRCTFITGQTITVDGGLSLLG